MASCGDPSIDNIMSPEDGEQTESNVRDRGTVSVFEGRFPRPNPDLRPDSPSFVHEASFAYGTPSGEVQFRRQNRYEHVGEPAQASRSLFSRNVDSQSRNKETEGLKNKFRPFKRHCQQSRPVLITIKALPCRCSPRACPDGPGRPLPETSQGHRYVLTVTCCFTKWTQSYPLKTISAKAVASTFVKGFICQYGLVKEIHTDQGRQFESELFQKMCVLLGIKKTRTTAFYPASDGLVESVQRSIQDMLSKYIKSNQLDWD